MLDMRSIAEKLSAKVQNIQFCNAKQKIDRVYLPEETQKSSDKILFLGRAEDFQPNRTYENILSIGTDKTISEYAELGRCNIITLYEQESFAAIFNMVQEILLEEQIKQDQEIWDITQAGDLHSIIRAISDYWGCTTILFDSNLTIRTHYPIEDKPYEYWLRFKKACGDDINNWDEPARPPMEMTIDGENWLFLQMKTEKKLLGYLMLCGCSKKNLDTLYSICQILTGKIADHVGVFQDEKVSFAAFILDILHGVRYYPAKMKPLLALANWSPMDSYYFIKIQAQQEMFSDEHMQNILDGLSERLSLQSFIYKNAAYAIINRTKSNNIYREDFVKWFTPLLSRNRVAVGFSDIFTQFHYIYDCIHQPEIAIQYGMMFNRRHVAHPYDFYAQYEIIDKLSSYTNMEQYVHPIIRLLDEYDRQFGTEYVTTIYAYLNEDRKLSATANYLGIHKNSLMKRLEKIRQITEFDFNLAFRTTHLRLSCSIVKHMRLLANDTIIELPELPTGK